MRFTAHQIKIKLREAIWCSFWVKFRAIVMARPGRFGAIVRGFHRYETWRLSKRVTALLGRRWRRSTKFLEIDLTYRCNMRCNDCNRSVTQAPENTQLDHADIQRHIQDWIARSYRWDRIRLLGGEPTLHPDFLRIVEDLKVYRREHAPKLIIEVISNGFGERVNKTLDQLTPDIRIVNTAKTSNTQPVHQTFNRAPCDFPEHQNSDFSNGCFVTELSGMGLTPSGYYHCAVAGGIDRIFDLKLGRDAVPEISDDMREDMQALCRFCGHFTAQMQEVPAEERLSPSWKDAYANWRTRRGMRLRGAEEEGVPLTGNPKPDRAGTQSNRIDSG
ncbi:radical SAM protein [Primorskyibacter sp. S187A]|uniref:radical SAM protein n=1 Tax=Primorskyibacter sp. S187A TaxID=3415130 RepID=UPI003C7CFAF7